MFDWRYVLPTRVCLLPISIIKKRDNVRVWRSKDVCYRLDITHYIYMEVDEYMDGCYPCNNINAFYLRVFNF